MDKNDDWHLEAVSLSKQGTSWRAIAKQLGKPKSTVYDYLKKYWMENSPKKEPSNTFMIRKERDTSNDRILLVSDLHIPYHHKDAFEFLNHLKEKYKPTRVISLGDECFDPSVEIMTENGFTRFDCLNHEVKVAQWKEDGTIEFVLPDRYVEKDYTGELIEFKHKAITVRCTPKHNLVKIRPQDGTVHRREAWDVEGSASWYIPRVGLHDGPGVDLTDDEIRLMVAFQADGTFTKGAARFSFNKERKEIRLKQLMDACGVPYNVHDTKRDRFQAYIEKANVPWYFTKEFNIPVKSYSLHQKKVFVDELACWDGTTADYGVRHSCVMENNTNYMQEMAVLSGTYFSKIEKHNCFYTDFIHDKENCSLSSSRVSLVPYSGKVYCVTVPSGMIMVRIDSHVLITGNCDGHSLSFHDHDPDLPSAGDEIRLALKYVSDLKSIFPEMDVLESNHGSLIWRKAMTHGIPRWYIKSYNDFLGVGDDWRWSYDLTVALPNGQKCYMHHGKSSEVIKLSQQMGMCAVQGHYHEKFKIDYWGNPNGLFWGLQAGCLVDDSALAFNYNNVNIKRPIVGTGLIIDSLPILEPMVLGTDGRWKH